MKIQQVILNTNHLLEVEEFYGEFLECKVLKMNDFEIDLQTGNSILSFQLVEYPVPAYHFAFNIPKGTLAHAKKFLESKEINLIHDPETELDEFEFKDWNAKSIYFFDPGMNIVELIERDSVATSSSGFKLLSISEVGVPVENVTATAENFCNENGVSLYEKDKPTENFTAVGDEEGMVIFVKEERFWFPTNIPAINDELEILIES